ncbi:hypothetical protein [Nocardia nova]|uniref:hypothetical protein n=1 Tax=Nocardia nova TaxID=37330 RepID=UPI002738AF1F|nr:hypothetical protein [Nocardia nova]
MTDNTIPDLDATQGARVLNPDAIGNPDVQPIVQLNSDMADWIMSQPGYCRACNGMNWFHSVDCPDCAEGEAH